MEAWGNFSKASIQVDASKRGDKNNIITSSRGNEDLERHK